MKNRLPLIPSLLVLAGTLALAGCAAAVGAAAGGAGTYAYFNGRLKDVENYPQSTVIKATKSALDDLKLPITKETDDGNEHTIIAHSAEDKISIYLLRQTDNTTEITISVGLLGDEKYSQMILDRIKAHLPN